MPGSVKRHEWVQRNIRVQQLARHLPRLSEPLAKDDLLSDDPAPDTTLETWQQLQATLLEQQEVETASQIDAARQEAEQWRRRYEEAQATAFAEGRAQGYAVGQQEGYQAGQNEAQQSIQIALTHIATLARNAVTSYTADLERAHSELADLSLAIAANLVGEFVQRDPAILSRRIAMLLERLADTAGAVIRLHPADLASVQPYWEKLTRQQGWTDQGIKLVADQTIIQGGCTISTRTQFLDAQIDVLIQQVHDLFAAPIAGEIVEEEELAS